MSSATSIITELSNAALAARREHLTAIKTLRTKTEAYTAAAAKRAPLKLAAVARIVQQDHPATPGKKFSASAADDYAQVDPTYAVYKREVERLELDRKEAELNVDAARLAAENAIADLNAARGIV